MREYVGMIILDLQKAFDTVNHKILINKLKALGLNQIAINWFVSYLRDREQIVDTYKCRLCDSHFQQNHV